MSAVWTMICCLQRPWSADILWVAMQAWQDQDTNSMLEREQGRGLGRGEGEGGQRGPSGGGEQASTLLAPFLWPFCLLLAAAAVQSNLLTAHTQICVSCH